MNHLNFSKLPMNIKISFENFTNFIAELIYIMYNLIVIFNKMKSNKIIDNIVNFEIIEN